MKRIWKPLDVGGLRLYKVKQYFIFKSGMQRQEQFAVFATSPSSASKIIENIYKGTIWLDDIASINYRGFPYEILMPKSWWEDGIPSERR